MKWVICWYENGSGNFVDQVDLPISTDKIKRLFDMEREENCHGCLSVTENQKLYLQSIFNFEINLEEFNYFLEDQKI